MAGYAHRGEGSAIDTSEDEMMGRTEFIIHLDRRVREDGSVMILSRDLPLFSVVGASVKEAIALTLELLPEYLHANVPDFVDLRTARSGDDVLLNRGETDVPAYVIATMGSNGHAGKSAE